MSFAQFSQSNFNRIKEYQISSKPLVTALICNYNYGRFLSQAIDSALNQTWKPLEVLVVDDGSTDESRYILESYRGRIRTILKENGGQASAFNLGISKAHGEIISFLDSDDFWYPNKIERTVSKYKEAPWGLVCNRLKEVDETGKDIIKKFHAQITGFRLLDGNLLNLVVKEGFSWVFSPTSGMSLPAQIAQDILPLPEKEWRICADNPLAYAAICHGPVGVIDETLGIYRYHGINGFSSIREDPVIESLYGMTSRTERYIFLKNYLFSSERIVLDKEPKDVYQYYRKCCFIAREKPCRYINELWKRNLSYHFINKKNIKLPWLNAVKFLIIDTVLAAIMLMHLPTKYRALQSIYRKKALSLTPEVRNYLETD